MNRNQRRQLERLHAETSLELIRTIANPSDDLFGAQARRGVRHALQSLVLAQGQDYQQDWSTQRLLAEVKLPFKLNVGPNLLDQYEDRACPPRVQNPLTQIPDHRFMIIADIRMLLELSETPP